MPETAGPSSGSSSTSVAQQVVNTAMQYVNRGNPYTYGGSGQALTDANVNSLANSFKGNSDAYYGHVKPGGKDYDKVNKSGMECVDCSGLTRKVFKKFGKNLDHSSKSQYNAGKDVGWKNALPGDLMVKSGHAAIMGSNGKLIEAKGWKWGCTNDRAPNSDFKAIRLITGGETVTTSGTTSTGGGSTSSSGSFNVNSAVQYNRGRNYSKAEWKMIQGVVGTDVDGDPGKKTATAIYEWQKSHGLEADGKCGPATYGAIKAASSGGSSSPAPTTSTPAPTTATPAPTTSTPAPSAPAPESSPSSSDVQINVSAAVSYNKGRNYSKELWKKIQAKVNTDVDGDPGKNTAKAIAVWQKANGLSVDGKCGPATLAKMDLDSASSPSPSTSTSTPAPAPAPSSSGTSASLPSGNVTEHFKWSEFACHDGSQVPNEYRANTKKLCQNLEILREALGGKSISVTSGYRSPSYNKKIDGAPKSQHMYGSAADIKVSGVSPAKVREKIKELGKSGKIFKGGLGKYDSFTHYDVRGSGGSFTTW